MAIAIPRGQSLNPKRLALSIFLVVLLAITIMFTGIGDGSQVADSSTAGSTSMTGGTGTSGTSTGATTTGGSTGSTTGSTTGSGVERLIPRMRRIPGF